MKRNVRLGALAARETARHAVGRGDGEERAVATAKEFVRVLGSMKGAAMKFGQVLSTAELPFSDPAVSVAFREELRALQADAPSVRWRDMERVMRDEWGEPISRVLDDIDEEPIASASIGQVYRGTVAGKPVAIKVQYPRVASAVESDMRSLRLVVPPLLSRVAPGVDARGLVGELIERVVEELDYELEASRHRGLQRHWKGHPWVWIPAVHTDLSRRRVLVTEWVEGTRWREILAADDATRDRMGEGMFRFYTETLTRFGVACGDPHPGNLLLAGDRIAFLDFGMVRQVDPVYHRGEQALVRATLDRDAAAAWTLMRDLGFLPEPDRFDPERLLDQLLSNAALWSEPGRVRLEPAVMRDHVLETRSPQSPHFDQMRKLTLPSQSLLIRRMEDLMWSGIAELRAEADWGGLMRESVGIGEVETSLGAADREWWRARGGEDRV